LSERVAERAKALENARKKTISLAYSPQLNSNWLAAICGLIFSSKPQIDLKLVSAHTEDQIPALLDGSVQLGLVTLPVRNESLVVRPLFREPLIVAVSESHRLSDKADLHIHRLMGMPLIVVARRVARGFHDHIHAVLTQHGCKPGVIQEVTADAEALLMAARGIGAALVSASAVPSDHRGIACYRLRESVLVQETGVAFRRSVRSPLVRTFITVLEQLAAQIPDGSSPSPTPADPQQLTLF
jgi:DNA-binding transcriptional LysR family regulator